MKNKAQNITNLENLLLSEDLEKLNNMTKTFNIFNALKIQNNEIRHSNFLAWLMSPFETHNLKDYFLKEFLKLAIKSFSLSEKTEITLHDVVFWNFDDAEIRREYKNIDILVVSSKNKFICIIENKIWSGEHSSQLEKYAKVVNTEYPNYKKMYIYLTPFQNNDNNLIKKSCNGRTVHYIPMSYEQVYQVIAKTLRFNSRYLNEEIKIFIEHYKKMIERSIMGELDTEVIELCRKIYREHKDAINLIVECSDERQEIFEILKEVLQERNDIEITGIGTSNITFLPNKIDNIDKLKIAKCNNYITQLQIINFKYRKNEMYIEFTIGEIDENIASKEDRNNLKEHLLKTLKLSRFNGNETWSYSPHKTIIKYDDYEKCENKEDVKKLIENNLKKIENEYIDDYRDALNSWKI